jgi:thiamine biosynthesis protein ThiS
MNQVPAVTIQLNGELREFPEGLTIDALISTLGLEPTRVAIELNRDVVRRDAWAATVLHHEDRVEIVHFVGGGVR